jgi:antitoxin component YwqK of YwqJK toxin-antitoxin module
MIKNAKTFIAVFLFTSLTQACYYNKLLKHSDPSVLNDANYGMIVTEKGDTIYMGSYIYHSNNKRPIDGTHFIFIDHAASTIRTFKNGKKNGMFCSYKNGHIWKLRNFVDGKKEGAFIEYGDLNKLQSIKIYKFDSLIYKVSFDQHGCQENIEE